MLYKCKNCGGELHFDPEIGKLKCDYCDSVYDVSEYEPNSDVDLNEASETIEQYVTPNEEALNTRKALDAGFEEATDDTTDHKEDLRLYQCPHCGAEVVTDKTTAATTCIFCQTPLMLQENMSGSFEPEWIIPFEIEPSQVKTLYQEYIRSKPFYPPEYAPANVIKKIKAVYLPFFLHDTNTSGQVQATGERTFTHTHGDWIITEHDVFELSRGGQMHFEKVPAIASSKTPRDAMDSIEPFDYSKMKPFSTGYLPGFLAERYDVGFEQLIDSVHQRIAHSFDAKLMSTMNGYSSIKVQGGTMNHEDGHTGYVLLPAYILFMDYDKDEDALIAINGQTGKIVGNIPVDKKKMIRYAIIHFILNWLILLVIAMALVIAL